MVTEARNCKWSVLLHERRSRNELRLQRLIYAPTTQPWGEHAPPTATRAGNVLLEPKGFVLEGRRVEPITICNRKRRGERTVPEDRGLGDLPAGSYAKNNV